jgi:hypothetical protein
VGGTGGSGWGKERLQRQDETTKEKKREKDRHSTAPGMGRYIGESVPGKRQTDKWREIVLE